MCVDFCVVFFLFTFSLFYSVAEQQFSFSFYRCTSFLALCYIPVNQHLGLVTFAGALGFSFRNLSLYINLPLLNLYLLSDWNFASSFIIYWWKIAFKALWFERTSFLENSCLFIFFLNFFFKLYHLYFTFLPCLVHISYVPGTNAKNAVISPNFQVSKLCGYAQFAHNFWLIGQNYAKIVPFHKISTLSN